VAAGDQLCLFTRIFNLIALWFITGIPFIYLLAGHADCRHTNLGFVHFVSSLYCCFQFVVCRNYCRHI